jgi:hypothetical protein
LPCRYKLQLSNCDFFIKKVYPKDLKQRNEIFEYYTTTNSHPQKYEMYKEPAVKLSSIPTQCRMYFRQGCSFVQTAQITQQSKKDWTTLLNRSRVNIREDYITPIDTVADFLAYYAGARAHVQAVWGG